MANLTVVIDEQLLQAARIKALQQGTSVNEICRVAIARFAQRDEAGAARLTTLRGLAAAMALSRVDSGADATQDAAQPAWPGRAALYEGVLQERGLAGPEGDGLGGRVAQPRGEAP